MSTAPLVPGLVSFRVPLGQPQSGVPSGVTARVDPASIVVLHEVIGGFNTVVEFSAERCARHLLEQLGLRDTLGFAPWELGIPPGGNGDQFKSPALRLLTTTNPILTPVTLTVQSGSPHMLFVDEEQLKFSVALSFSIQPSENATARPSPRTQVAATRASAGTLRPGANVVPIATYHPVDCGSATLELTAGYRLVVDVARQTVVVVVDLQEIEIATQPLTLDGDFILSRIFASAADLGRLFACATVATLCADISLVGPRSVPDDTPAWPRFVVKKRVVEVQGRQALALAFTLRPGCEGSPSDLRNFLGDADYGVIQDEFAIEGTLKYRWSQGGFARNLYVQSPMQVRQGDDEIDAVLNGALMLQTLDVVRLASDANAAVDCIELGGQATMHPVSIVTSDGDAFLPPEVDLGPDGLAPWALRTTLTLDIQAAADLQLESFQLQAHEDAYRYLARPFDASAVVESANVVYVRLDGTAKYLFQLGSMPN